MNTQNNSISIALDNFLTQKLALRRGERLLVFLLQLCICLIVTVLLILKPLFSGLMLSEYSVEIMPLAYVLIAVSAVVVHFALNAMQRSRSLYKSILVNQWLHIIILTVLGVLNLSTPVSGMMTVVLYVYASLYAVVTVSYFYQYCQSILTIRDAKRLYGYIGAGAIAGGIAGGYLTNSLIEIINKSGLLFLSAGFLLITCLIYYYINKLDSEDLDLDFSRQPKKLIGPNAFALLKNKHVLNVAMLMGFGVLVSRLVDYQFSYLALKHVATSNDLASFFGFWFSTINVIGLVIQLFVVHLLVDRYGITKSMMSMPILLLSGLLALIFFPILFFGILIKLFDGGLKQSLYKTSTELVIMPLKPNLRRRAKIFIDVVIDSIATGFAGFLIYYFGNILGLTLVNISFLTILTCSIWIYFIFRSSQSYQTVLLKQLKVDAVNNTTPQPTNLEYINEYVNTRRGQGQSVKSSLNELIQHEDHSIRILALREYSRRYPDGDRAMVYNMVHSDHSPLKEEAFRLILGWCKTPKSIEDLYTETQVSNQPYLLSALADSLHYKAQIKKFKVHDKISLTHHTLLDQYRGQSKVLSKSMSQLFNAAILTRHESFYSYILAELQANLSPPDQRSALDAISLGADPYFFDSLQIEQIHHSNLEAFYKCLATFPTRLLSLLKGLIDQPKQLLQYLPACSYVDNQKSLNFLFALLNHKNTRVRRKSLYIINYLKKNFDYLNYNHSKSITQLSREITFLKKLMASQYLYANKTGDEQRLATIRRGLKREINSSLIRVFIHIGLITERDDINIIYSAIKSKRRDSGLDVLDSILPFKLRRRVIPVIEAVVTNACAIDDLRRLNIKLMNEKKLLRFVKTLKDDKLKRALVFNLATRTRLTDQLDTEPV